MEKIINLKIKNKIKQNKTNKPGLQKLNFCHEYEDFLLSN